MSFARAPLKRFNEHVGCSTGPGDYDIKPAELKGPVTFHRSDRFRPTKEAAADLPPPPPPPSPSSVSMSPVRIRRTMSADGLVEGSSAKKGRSGVTMEMKLQCVLEKEIRSLVQQRGEQDQKLQSLEEELKKLHAKLLTAVREKTALSANMATLERQLAELNKANKFLKNKASADATKKQINSLMMELMEARKNLDAKNKELNDLHITTEGQLQALETDLQTTRTALTTLGDRKSDLEDRHQAMNSRNEELEKEMHGLMEELRAEVRALQGYLDIANEEIQDLRRKCEREEPDETATKVQQEKLCELEREVELRTVELQHLQSVVRQKEEESASCQQKIGASQDALRETEERLNSCEVELRCSQEVLGNMAVQMKETSEALDESLCKVSQQGTELTRLRDVLTRTEQEVDERTSQLAESRLRHEEAMSRIQQEGLRQVELEAELGALRAVGTEERNERIQLQQDHDALTEQLQKEKALVASLSLLLQQEKAVSDQRMKDLRDEMEEVLGELAAMEEQEGSRQGMLTETQGGFLILQQDHAELEKRLSETRALLDSKMKEMSALEENHSLAMRSLQEQHTDSLHKTRDTAAELESIKRSLQQAAERSRTLEEEVERVTHQMKEEMVATIQRDDDARRMREETDGMHRAAQEEWARKIKEMAALEENHSLAMRSLQEQHTDSLHKTRDTAAELESIKQSLQQAEERSRTLEEELERVTHRMKEEMVATIQKKDDDARRLMEEANGANRAAQEEWQRELKRTEEASHATLALRLKEQVKSVEASHVTLVDQLEEQMKCLHDQVETLAQEKVTLQWEMLEQRKDLEGQLAEAQDSSSSEWKQKYEELLAKVKPFQEQLNGFAAEKDALLNMNGSNQEELNRLAEAYARLLGHQNHKQKIKHMVKLKDDNLALKQEVSNLRSQVTRQKSQMEQLRSDIPGAARRRFDPSKAFQCDVKENRQPEMPVALRDGGNHHYL